MSKHKYGWIPSKPHDAKKYSLFHTALPTLPVSIDLRPKDCPIYDQTTLGSCTANGSGGVFEYVQRDITPSRLFIYWNTRNIEGTTDEDSGGTIHDAVQTLVANGVCSETLWPYDVDQFETKPPQICYNAAKLDVAVNYFNLETLEDIKQCLSAEFPVVFGITLYESFEGNDVATTGIVPVPHKHEQVIGGHCMVVVGYDDTDPNNKTFIIRNSWGTGWGQKGYAIIPQDMFEQYASDFWTVRTTSLK